MELFEQTVAKWWPYVHQKLGITNIVHDAAIWGNGGEESAGFKTLHQVGGTAEGGWQFDGARKNAFKLFCATSGRNEDDILASIDFMIQECLTTESHALEQTKKTTSLEAATETFMLDYERPGVPALQVRINYAKRALAVIQATQPKPQPPTQPQTQVSTSVADTPVTTTPASTPATTTSAPIAGPVEQLAAIIKQEELALEDVAKAFLVSKGFPTLLIDLGFHELNQIDVASLLSHVDWAAVISKIFNKSA